MQPEGRKMVRLLTQPPPADTADRIAAIDGVEVAPVMLWTQRGPDGDLGPEAAGALLMLQATFVDEAGAAAFWTAAAGLFELLATTPGFIRRFGFAHGLHSTLIAQWRTAADANAFFATAEHQAAMRQLFSGRWQQSHFAGLFEMPTPRHRVIFCQHCDGVTSVQERVCCGCGRDLFDPFRMPEGD
jgi:heme-degrading monooxygenase HmoA